MDQSLLDAHGCVHDAMLADNPGKGGWPRMSSQKTRCMHGWHLGPQGVKTPLDCRKLLKIICETAKIGSGESGAVNVLSYAYVNCSELRYILAD